MLRKPKTRSTIETALKVFGRSNVTYPASILRLYVGTVTNSEFKGGTDNNLGGLWASINLELIEPF